MSLTSFINSNLDMFDVDEPTMSVSEAVQANAEFPMYFEIINADAYRGDIENRVCIWRYEFRRGEESFIGDAYYFDGSAEENAFQYDDISYITWPMCLHGLELTGRVWFGGYAIRHFGFDEEGDWGEWYEASELFAPPEECP